MSRPAARIGDPVAHTAAMPGLLAGAVLGAALAVAVVATGGLAAVAAGAMIAGGVAGGALAGEYIGAASMGPPTGMIAVGSPDVFVNGRPAAMANLSVAMCAKEYGAPQPVAQGAATVFINGMPAARRNDRLVCSAQIAEGSPNVFFDDRTVQTLPIAAEVPQWLNTTLQAVAIGAAIVGFGAAIAAVGFGAACAGLAGSLAGGFLGQLGGRALGEALGLSESAMRTLEVAGGLGGSILGGIGATRAYESFGKTALGEPTPPSDRVPTSGCPISMHTGEELLTREDFVWTGPLTLAWKRFYRTAQCETDVQLGHGWLTPLDEWIQLHDGGGLTYHDREGRRIALPLPEPGRTGCNKAEHLRIHRVDDHVRIVPESGPQRVFALGPGRRPLKAWRSADGHRIDLVYDPQGQVESLRASWGKVLLVRREGARIVGIGPAVATRDGLRPGGAPLVRYEYDPCGDLVAALDRLDQGERYAYDGHLLVRRTLATGFNFQFAWDSAGSSARCVRNWGDEGIHDHRFEWDKARGLSRAIDARGGVTEYEHDTGGRLLRVTSPEGVTERFRHSGGQLAEIHGPAGIKAHYEHDDAGRIVKIRDAAGATRSLAYDEAGHVTELRDPSGAVWRWAYDDAGRLREVVDPVGDATRYRFNEQGLLAEVRDAMDRRRLLWWDDRARLVAELGFDGVQRRFGYDEDDRVTTVTTQDKRKQRHVWDAAGRLVAVERADGSRVQMRYNARGRLTHWIDGNGHVTEYRYREGLNQPSERIDPLGQVMRYRYDKARNLVGLVNANGDECRLAWDKDNRLVEQVGFDGRVQRYRYDEAGRLAEKAEAAGIDDRGQPAWQVTRMWRDRAGRLVEKLMADGGVARYRFDPCGRLLEAHTEDHALRFSYDALGRIVGEQQGDARFIHAYDAIGRRTSTRYPDGRALRYRWDERGGLAELTLDGRTLTRHRRDEFMQEVAREQGAVSTRYEYDPNGRLALQQSSMQGRSRALLARRYVRDPGGRIAAIGDLRQGVMRAVYDPADRLVGVEGATREQFVHDPANNLMANGRGLSKGNRLCVLGDRHFDYDAFGNLVRERSGKGGRRVRRFEYDASHRLVAVHTAQGTHRYRYDALGRRIAKLTRDGDTSFFWDGARLAGEATVAAGTRAPARRWYVYEPGSFRPLACFASAPVPPARGWRAFVGARATEDSKVCYYHLDHAGTPREMTDAQGRIVWSGRYGAWGALARADVHRIDNPLRFQGQYHDAETGLHYNLMRYYDPRAGRFIHQDPIGLKGGDNLYAYAPNPLNWVDPLGLDPALLAQLGDDANSAGVYRFTDNTGRPYVGSTTDQDFATRLGQHMDSGKLPQENVGSVRTYPMNGSPDQDIYNVEASEIVRNGGRATDGGATSNVRAPSGTRDNFHDDAWLDAERSQRSRFDPPPDCA
jgi:RHS repeat-associated protein